jgi:protein gp37
VSTSTGIEWTDATWNPVRGCSMAKGSQAGGCLNCYAARQASRNFPGMRSPTTGEAFAVLRDSGPRWTGKVELIESALEIPLHWKKPRRVFVNSMSDLFHEGLPDEAIDRVFAVMAVCPQHTFQVLTKRSDRMRRYLSTLQRIALPGGHSIAEKTPLPNVWLGVSVENRATCEARLYDLGQTPAAKRFISYEPALEALGDFRLPHLACNMGLPNPDWIIVGGESGPGARPFDIQWARDTIEVCKLGRIACFVKQLGANPFQVTKEGYSDRATESLHLRDPKGGDWSEWPDDLRVRQFPEDRQRRTDIPQTHTGGK